MEFKNFHDYYEQLSELLQTEDSDDAETAATLLSIKDDHSDYKFLQNSLPRDNPTSRHPTRNTQGKFGTTTFPIASSDEGQEVIKSRVSRVWCRKLVPNPVDVYSNRNAMDWAFDDIILLHCQTLYMISVRDWHSACGTQTSILQLFNKEILQKEKDANWFVPILYTICSDLRLLARMADANKSRMRRRKDEGISYYEEAASPIMESYRICVAESRLVPETTKKIAILNLTNQLFRIYFKINRLHLLKPLIRSIEHVEDLYNSFSMADKITYNYFLGRKAMFDMDLILSEKSLSFAVQHCPASYTRNKRFILMYLIPVKMFLGHMPTPRLLKHYDLEQFSQVVVSVKDGNLKLLNQALQEHQHFFIKCGIFLMLEKLKVITYRNLFKKVAYILDTHLLKLDAFSVVLSYLGSEMDSDELACILANLIAQKKIKGYISHQKQTLVVSKQAAFPPLSLT